MTKEHLEDDSLDTQQCAVDAYCKSPGWSLVHEYRDEGKSAWTDVIAKRSAFA